MSRRFTLEEYLKGFVDEHTEAIEQDTRLLVTDAQVQTVGWFFIEGIAGLIECLRKERETPRPRRTKRKRRNKIAKWLAREHFEFIN